MKYVKTFENYNNDNINESLSKDDKKVIDYAKKWKGETFLIYGVPIGDVRKMINKPEDTHSWENDYFNKVEKAVDKLLKDANEEVEEKK